MKLGLLFSADDFPFGLRCTTCDRPFREGERYAIFPYATARDGCTITTALCVSCLLDSPSERRGHAA